MLDVINGMGYGRIMRFGQFTYFGYFDGVSMKFRNPRIWKMSGNKATWIENMSVIGLCQWPVHVFKYWYIVYSLLGKLAYAGFRFYCKLII